MGADENEGKLLPQTQEALKQSEKLLADFFENAPVGLHWIGPDGVVLRANRTELELLGYAKEEFVGRHITEFHADDLIAQGFLEKLLLGETIESCEARLRCKDGSLKDVLISSNALWEEGKFVHARCFTRDVTALKQAQVLQTRLAAIVEGSDDGIIGKTLEGIVTSWNKGAECIFGYRAEEMIGQSIRKIIPIERQAEEDLILGKLRRGERVEHYETVRVGKDGRMLHVSLTSSPIRDGVGKVIGASKIVRDITGSKQAQDALRDSEERLRATFNQAAVGFAIAGMDGYFLEMNRKFSEILGYSFAELQQRTFLDITHPDDILETKEHVGQLLAGLIADYSQEKRYVRKDGAIVWSLTTVTVLKDAQGKPRRFIGVIENITKRKQAEAALQAVAIDNARLYEEAKEAAEERKRLLDSERSARSEAERMSAMKDEFLTTLSHELRTPLNAILGWSQVLRYGARHEADLVKGFDAIERNARIQAQLIEDLLDMSRITAGKLRLEVQPVDPASVVEAAVDTLRPAADAKGVRLEKLLDPAGGLISGDPGRLQQVIWNLLSNAIKFTPKNGRVQVFLERRDSHIEINVSDTGIGIKPEFLPHVFERFRQADASTTRKFGGLGLGLSIVKHLVELHGGTVQVTSAGDGQGACFTVRLPLRSVHGDKNIEDRATSATSKLVSTAFKTIDLSGVTVLVVDDEMDARDLIKRVLIDCDANVLTAATADEALLIVERERPDVLVSDIGMPEVDGYELLRRVRALGQRRGGRIPAVALTAFARSEDRTQALRAGFLVHVAKPVEPSELIATVASVAGRTGDRLE